MSSSNYKLINYILARLFDSEDNRIKMDSIQLVRKNREARGTNISGVFYQGQYFSDHALGMKNVTNGPLHLSLRDMGDRLVADMKSVSYDKDRIRQMLSLMLEGLHDWQDIRDAIPNSIAALIADTAHLERTKEIGFNLSEQHKQFYNRIKDKIDYYAVLHLIN